MEELNKSLEKVMYDNLFIHRNVIVQKLRHKPLNIGVRMCYHAHPYLHARYESHNPWHTV